MRLLRKDSSLPAILLIAVVGLLCYSNTFDVPFVFDDTEAIVENPLIKDLGYFTDASDAEGFEGLRYNAFKTRYIGYLSFALNYMANGLDVGGYHVVNLLIHIMNGMLIYFLVSLTFEAPFLAGSRLRKSSGAIALVSALLFVSHPVQTQAVTYIVQRLASMATMFYLLSMVLYIRARLSKGGRWPGPVFYGLSLAAAVLGMYTKQITFTLPLAVLMYELLFFSGPIKRRILYVAPLLLTMLIIPMSIIDTDRPIGEMISDAGSATRIQDMSRTDYLLTEFRVIVTYLRLLVFPAGQNLDYDYPVYGSVLEPQVYLSLLSLLSILGLGVYLMLRSRISDGSLRVAAFGIFWMFLALSVESGMIPLHVIYEHRVYLPSVGFFTALSTAGFLLLERYRGTRIKQTALVMAVLVLVFQSYATHSRNSVWRSSTGLWEDVVAKSPDKGRGHNNLGEAYEQEGRTERAVEEYLTAIRLDPSYPQAYNNLGNVYRSQGRLDEAVGQYMKAIEIDPKSIRALNNLGTAYMGKGLMDEAVAQYKEALKLNPLSDSSHYNLGVAYGRKGLYAEAVEQYEKAIELNPYLTEAHNNLGVIYRDLGLTDKAIGQYTEALKQEPDYEEAMYNLGVAYWDEGHADKAIEQFMMAVNVDPDDEDTHLALGVAYSKVGALDSAREELETVLRLNPDDARASGMLNWVKERSR